jgi:hypothetical protein
MKYVVVGIVCFVVGWFVGYGLPQPQSEPEIIYVNRDAPDFVGPVARMGSNLYRPLQPTTTFRYSFIERETLRIDTVYVPVNFNVAGVISDNPITFRRNELLLTYFDTDSLRFTQRLYSIPQRDFHLSLSLHTFTDIQHFDPYVGINLMAHRRRLSIGAGAYLSIQRPPTYLLHIKYNLL